MLMLMLTNPLKGPHSRFGQKLLAIRGTYMYIYIVYIYTFTYVQNSTERVQVVDSAEGVEVKTCVVAHHANT